MSAVRCRMTNRAGAACGAPPLAGQDVCAIHADPEHARRLQSAGGKAKPHGSAELRAPRLDSIPSVQRFLRRVLQAAIDGNLASAQVRSAVEVVNAAVAVLRVSRDLDGLDEVRRILDAVRNEAARVQEARQATQAPGVLPGAIAPSRRATGRTMGPEGDGDGRDKLVNDMARALSGVRPDTGASGGGHA